MAELYESVVILRDDEKCMTDLARSAGLSSLAGAQRAYEVAVPVVMSGLLDTSSSPDGAANLLASARSLRWNERSRPEELFGRTSDTIGEEVVAHVFGDLLPSVRVAVAADAEVSEAGAQALLEATSLVGLATVAGSIAGEELDEATFVAAIQKERAAVPADPVAAAAASLESADIREQARLKEAEEAEQRAFIAAGAAAAVGVAAVGATDDTQQETSTLSDDESAAEGSDEPDSSTGAVVESALAEGAVLPVPEPVSEAVSEPLAETPQESSTTHPEPTEPTLPAFATPPRTISSPSRSDGSGASPVRERRRSDDDEPAGNKGMFVLAAIGILALVGAGYFLFTSGSDGSTDQTILAQSNPSVDDAGEVSVTPTTELAVDLVDTTVSDNAATPADEPTDDPVNGVQDEAAAGDVVTLSVPMVDIEDLNSDAEGTLTFDFNTVTGEVCYTIDSINIEGPYRSHIHVGEAGVKGGIVVDLGPQEPGATGCVANLPVDTNAILANPGGHYAELHDVSEEFTIRGQLSEAVLPADTGADDVAVVDTEGGGARTVLDGGTIYLEGDVPDQATADELAGTLGGIDTPVVNNLRVVEGAPLPSGRIIIADAIFFDFNSDVVKTIPEESLRALSDLATSREDWILTVVGHTDGRGTDVYNLELSLRRAGALRDLLIDLGVPKENLRIRGAGETAPIGDNNTDAGRAQNRRIEFEFTPQG